MRAVIGANFGDEGKGLVTDWLCSQGAGIVVRFNGGAQAGHTVVTPEGVRHVFGHFGSGSLQGIPTYLSQFFVVNPLLFLTEAERLQKLLPVAPQVYASPLCLVTTFADMVINQRIEEDRGGKRHGSVGVGFNETHVRSELPRLKITMGDLWSGLSINDKLAEICGKYAKFRTGAAIGNPDAMIEAFVQACNTVASVIHPLGISQCEDPVFEGAQGLLLDQGNKEFFPHVTRSNTGLQNVRALVSGPIDVYYVSRTYLTRHGAGLLPNEDSTISFHDDTNMDHPFQGRLRFAALDNDALLKRCHADAGGKFKLVLTHCDQLAPSVKADFHSFGPTRVDVESIK